MPDYMIPPLFQYVETIPLTPNGKVDKQALAPPQSMAAAEGALSTAAGAERILLEELREVLGKPVTMEDHFLYAGGDSIRAIQLEARLQRKGYRLKARDILQFPNHRDMASHLEINPQAGETHTTFAGSAPFLPIHHWIKSPYSVNGKAYVQPAESLCFMEKAVNEDNFDLFMNDWLEELNEIDQQFRLGEKQLRELGR